MESETWEQAQDLFEPGLQAAAAGRKHLLEGAQPEIAALVRDLWRQHAEAGAYLRAA